VVSSLGEQLITGTAAQLAVVSLENTAKQSRLFILVMPSVWLKQNMKENLQQ